MYLEMVGEEDRKMAEGWKADAEGILIFVSFYLSFVLHNLAVIDRFIFRSRGDINLNINPIYSAKLARRPHVLCRKHLSGSC